MSTCGEAAAAAAETLVTAAIVLALDRPKDRAHVPILRRFIEEEVVHAFEQANEPRERIAPARRLLQVIGSQVLDERLAARLLPLARTPADFRFLASVLPTPEVGRERIARASSQELREELESIRARRTPP